MFDNMSEFVAAMMREDAQAWAARQAPIRAAESQEHTGARRREMWRLAVAKRLRALAATLAPTGERKAQAV